MLWCRVVHVVVLSWCRGVSLLLLWCSDVVVSWCCGAVVCAAVIDALEKREREGGEGVGHRQVVFPKTTLK